MSPTDRTADVVVVGGGLVGCLTARALASTGRSVRLVERDADLGRRASTAAAGMLSPQMESAEGLLAEDAGAAAAMLDLCLAARVRYPAFVRDLEAETGRRVHYRTDGTLVVGLDEDEAERLEKTAVSQVARGLRAEFLSGARARRLEPALSADIRAALHLPDDHQVDPVALMEAAAAALGTRRGVTIATGADVEAVLSERGAVTGVRTSRGPVVSPTVVIAAGAWSGRIAGLPGPLPVRPVKGQMAAVRLPRPPIRHTVGSLGAYCVPREEGRVVIGATVEEAGFDDRVTPAGIDDLLAAARRFLPGLAGRPLDSTWAGLRPGTPDGLPIIGEDPRIAGLVYATGHYRNGILLAPLTAECVAALVAGEAPPVDLGSFAPDRAALGCGPPDRRIP